MDRLKGKVVIVTGAASGIGAVFSQALAAEGAQLILADIANGEGTADAIVRNGGLARFVSTDVSDKDSVGEMVATAVSEFGRIDGLVNNAAIFASLNKKPFLEIDPSEWDKVMDVNVRGPFLCSQAVAPHMISQNHGKILNIASGTVFKGMAGMLHYVSSKGAVVAMTRCLARELGASGVCVNAIAPGLTMSENVATNPTWQGKGAEATVASRAIPRSQVPADLIGALLFFCSQDSDFVTGQTLVVDGGAVMK
ncbi:SDR family NAD(P)-dependent oxidoreductase [Rhizobium sp. WYJ-E13]|uniref:SDR family NAD(P)-dependent oxidoreductase n=1 Tax=Rhizobium sp. WYJ-E13 TaxID=2849093 RepID=UPI001C1EA32C|nr:SDR family oxidoreductase [Rhizobium sp. WYJ-E13]QWW72381.1 SDR family oxidoreductase [Rhizobium sp. WYJ-E13]